MWLFPLLLIGSGFILSAVIWHLDQSVISYYDFVALFIVLGGTLLVGALSLPWEYRKDLLKAFKFLFMPEKSRYREVLEQSRLFFLGETAEKEKTSLFHLVLFRGDELLRLGMLPEKVQEILEDLISMQIRRYKRVAFAVKNLAKYPPAFGLVGTVFGLVNLMKRLEGATDASSLGVQMSIALVATMYGLLLANFVINPIGEFLLRKAEEEEEYADIALNAVRLKAQDEGYLVFMEQMAALVPADQAMTSEAKETLAA